MKILKNRKIIAVLIYLPIATSLWGWSQALGWLIILSVGYAIIDRLTDGSIASTNFLNAWFAPSNRPPLPKNYRKYRRAYQERR